MRKVVIFYPSKITGGAEFLLKTAAELLKKTHDVTIIDISKGWLSENIAGTKIKILEENMKVELGDDVVLVTTANLIRYLDSYFIGQFKIIAWIVHPFNLIPVFPKIGSIQFSGFFKTTIKKTILKSEYKKIDILSKYLQEKKSLYIMDDACNDVFFNFFQRRIIDYLPAVISDEKIQVNREEINWNKSCTECIWLGRLDNKFKNPILHHVLLDISTYARKSNAMLVFHIVGDGPGLNAAVNFSNNINNIKIHFHKEKTGSDLSEIIKKCNIGFSMGMSALEVAAYAIPVILLDASYAKVPVNYRYQWLSEAKGFSLGRSIDNSSDKTLGNEKSIDDVFIEFNANKMIIGEECRAHVRKHHSINALHARLIAALENTTSNFQEVENLGLIKKPYWHRIKKIFK